MRSFIDRRTFLKAGGALAVGTSLARFSPSLRAAEAGPGAPNADKIGWRLGCQAYSFNRFTFFEAVEKNQSLGLRVLEAFPGQKLSADEPDVKIGDSMSPQSREAVKKKLAEANTKLVNYGVVGLPNDEVAARKIFDFAKDMGVETIVSEPEPAAFDLLDKLCEEYQINVALHNHPEPSRYWKPEIVLEAVKNQSKRIGACADTGHWMRSGINPLDAIKKLQGRIISFHLKDLNKYGRQGSHDVPWGTGEGKLKDVLAEVYRQGFQGVFSIEYEYNWLESVPEIAQCVAFFNQTAAELAARK